MYFISKNVLVIQKDFKTKNLQNVVKYAAKTLVEEDMDDTSVPNVIGYELNSSLIPRHFYDTASRNFQELEMKQAMKLENMVF